MVTSAIFTGFFADKMPRLEVAAFCARQAWVQTASTKYSYKPVTSNKSIYHSAIFGDICKLLSWHKFCVYKGTRYIAMRSVLV